MLLHVRAEPSMRLAMAGGRPVQRTRNSGLVHPGARGKNLLTDPLACEEVGDGVLQFHPPDA